MNTKTLKSSRARENRKKIFETAVGQFNQHGYDGVTMDDIAVAAGVARSSVFNHYPSKFDVLKEFFEKFTFGIIAEAKDSKSRRFKGRMKAFFTAAGKAAPPHKIILAEIAAQAIGHGPMAAVESQVDQHLMGFILDAVSCGQSAGDLRAEIDKHFLANLILALVTVTLHDWINGVTKKRLEHELQARFEILLMGASTR